MGLDAPPLENAARTEKGGGLKMAEKKNTKKKNKSAVFAAGLCLLIAGVTAILAWWPDVVVFVRGLAGMTMAVGGLLILYFLTKL